MNNEIKEYKINNYKLTYFKEIDSTNTYLMREYKNLEEYSVIVSDTQTKGKGRLGRKWVDNGQNIAISILVKPDFSNVNMQDISKMTLVCGASAFDTISMFVPSSIKWPNDILVNGKKICGILCESVISEKLEALVLGIGININQLDFDEEIKNKATSLKKELNKEIDKLDVINKFLISFDDYYKDFLNGGKKYLDTLKNNFYLKNRKGYINNNEVQIEGIDDDGQLIIIENGEVKRVFSGEVTLEKFYN